MAVRVALFELVDAVVVAVCSRAAVLRWDGLHIEATVLGMVVGGDVRRGRTLQTCQMKIEVLLEGLKSGPESVD